MSHAMTMPAIKATFPDEWVAAEVTQVDSVDVPLAGDVAPGIPGL